MCVYFAYILCFRITLFHLNTVIGVLFLGIFVKKHSIACKFIYLCVCLLYMYFVFFFFINLSIMIILLVTYKIFTIKLNTTELKKAKCDYAIQTRTFCT